jgi:ubiquinone/menaquinone biosynthesis C-methylase UbiE
VINLEVKEFFDRYWKNRNLRWFDSYYDFLNLINKDVFEKLSNLKCRKILIIGAGDTKDVTIVQKISGDTIAVDISMEGLKPISKINRTQMDASCLGFKTESFDAIFLRTVMLHIDYRKVLKEIKRVLKDKGRFFWIEPMQNNIFLWLYRAIFSPGKLTRTRYLTYGDVQSFSHFFSEFWHREYFIITVFFLPFYVFIPPLRRGIDFFISVETNIINRFPFLKKVCWISYGYGEV